MAVTDAMNLNSEEDPLAAEQEHDLNESNRVHDEPSEEDDIILKPSDLEGITVNPAGFADLPSGKSKPKANGQGATGSPRGETANLDMLLDIGLQVTVELGRARMTIREVLSLGPGTVVELNRVAGEPVDILINGKPIAKGEVVVLGDMFGVRVTDIIPPAQRVESMM